MKLFFTAWLLTMAAIGWAQGPNNSDSTLWCDL